MAAGVSIRSDFLLGFSCILLFLIGATGLRGGVEISYSYDPQIHDVLTLVELGHHSDIYRHRRDADDDDSSGASPSSSADSDASNNTDSSAVATAAAESSDNVNPSTDTNSTGSSEGADDEAPTQPAAPTTTTTTTTAVPQPVIKEEMDHTYYTTQYVSGAAASAVWLDLSTQSEPRVTYGTLSNSHRTAATVKLSFDFMFYGHMIDQVTIATGGFLYMSDFLHQWLTATQYIAPLMANFDTQLGNNSFIHYVDNGSMLAVQWEDVHLQDSASVGTFNFQAVLHSSGAITFAYKNVPVNVQSISSAQHPVKVGLSDAYYMDRQEEPDGSGSDVRKRTIYEYHRVSVPTNQVHSGAAIKIQPLPTCVEQRSCHSCVSASINFTCTWCSAVERCSDSFDRQRQQWLESNCHSKNNMSGVGDCPSVNVWLIIFMVALACGILFIIALFIYAYRNPQSKSGMWLIEHRPSNLKEKLNKVKFWKKNTSGGADKYEVSMQPEGDSVA